MSPLLAVSSGILTGLFFVMIGHLLVRPAIGGELTTLMARFVAAFLLKLLLIVVLVAAVVYYSRDTAVHFALAMMATFLPLLILQFVLYGRVSRDVDPGKPHD